VPFEISAANAKPVRTADRLWEAHDLILKAWTTHDGPFNWEGRYFHHRQVNIWPRPFQQPHPPVWITTTTTTQVPNVADRDYTAAMFLTGIEPTKLVFDAYRRRRAEQNLPMREERLAYSAMVYVGDTDAEGLAGARKIGWILTHNIAPIQFMNPPGYASLQTSVKLMRGAHYAFDRSAMALETLVERGLAFAGNPDTVYRQIKRHYDAVGGYGNLLMLGQAGFLEHDDTEKSIKLFAREVYPRLKELRPSDATRAVAAQHV